MSIESLKNKPQHCFWCQQQIKQQLSDRQLIVIVCALLIIHAVCPSHSQKTREVLLLRVGGGELGAWSVSIPLCHKIYYRWRSKISTPETDLFAFSSEVVTLTFPVAYVIPPNPRSPCVLSWSLSYWRSGPCCNFKCIFEVKNKWQAAALNLKFKTSRRLEYRKVGFKDSSGARFRHGPPPV